jgi:hypothetical protein
MPIYHGISVTNGYDVLDFIKSVFHPSLTETTTFPLIHLFLPFNLAVYAFASFCIYHLDDINHLILLYFSSIVGVIYAYPDISIRAL